MALQSQTGPSIHIKISIQYDNKSTLYHWGQKKGLDQRRRRFGSLLHTKLTQNFAYWCRHHGRDT